MTSNLKRVVQLHLGRESLDFQDLSWMGAPMLDPGNQNDKRLRKSLGRLLAEAKRKDDIVEFFIKNDDGGYPEIKEFSLASRADIQRTPSLNADYQELCRRVEGIRPNQNYQDFCKHFDDFGRPFSEDGKVRDNFHNGPIFFIKWRADRGDSWKLSLVWGFTVKLADPNNVPVLCARPNCHALFLSRAAQQQCPVCKGTSLTLAANAPANVGANATDTPTSTEGSSKKMLLALGAVGIAAALGAAILYLPKLSSPNNKEVADAKSISTKGNEKNSGLGKETNSASGSEDGNTKLPTEDTGDSQSSKIGSVTGEKSNSGDQDNSSASASSDPPEKAGVDTAEKIKGEGSSNKKSPEGGNLETANVPSNSAGEENLPKGDLSESPSEMPKRDKLNEATPDDVGKPEVESEPTDNSAGDTPTKEEMDKAKKIEPKNGTAEKGDSADVGKPEAESEPTDSPVGDAPSKEEMDKANPDEQKDDKEEKSDSADTKNSDGEKQPADKPNEDKTSKEEMGDETKAPKSEKVNSPKDDASDKPDENVDSDEKASGDEPSKKAVTDSGAETKKEKTGEPKSPNSEKAVEKTPSVEKPSAGQSKEMAADASGKQDKGSEAKKSNTSPNSPSAVKAGTRPSSLKEVSQKLQVADVAKSGAEDSFQIALRTEFSEVDGFEYRISSASAEVQPNWVKAKSIDGKWRLDLRSPALKLMENEHIYSVDIERRQTASGAVERQVYNFRLNYVAQPIPNN